MTIRSSLRVAAVCASAPLVLLTASPAFAYTRDVGDDPGPGLTALQTIALYVLAPLVLFSLIALLVYAPSLARGPRYRPGLSWWAQPVWFNGPAQGGTAPSGATPAEATTRGGGTSARW